MIRTLRVINEFKDFSILTSNCFLNIVLADDSIIKV